MNPLTLHEEYAVSNLNDRTAWRALLDHHEQETECDHWTALRYVAGLRQRERRNREVGEASLLLSRKSPLARVLLQAISAHFLESRARAAPIVVFPGFRNPKVSPTKTGQWMGSRTDFVVTVGAKYVLKLARIWREMRGMPNETKLLVLDVLNQSAR